jgi:1-acyl-sn-glycerol-3-phosphate acyltransferase
MVRSTLQDTIDRVQRAAGSATGQIVEVTGDGAMSGRFAELWQEIKQAAVEARSMLAGGDWRLSEAELERRTEHLLRNQNLSEYGVDPFGFSPEYVKMVSSVLQFVHRVYFRTEVFNIDRVPEKGRCLLIANHSGQMPFDGLVIGSSLLLDRDPPRMVRSMIEKFIARLPVFGTFCVRCGQITGLPDNCRRLLENEESVLVFPEGARGISKPFSERYQMTQFGHGFMRLALETASPIVPIAVVGAEEQVINLHNSQTLARLFNTPSFPLPPMMLLLGPMALWPMPVKYRIYFGEPMHFDGDANDDEAVISAKVARVREAVEVLIRQGLDERKGIFV